MEHSKLVVMVNKQATPSRCGSLRPPFPDTYGGFVLDVVTSFDGSIVLVNSEYDGYDPSYTAVYFYDLASGIKKVLVEQRISSAGILSISMDDSGNTILVGNSWTGEVSIFNQRGEPTRVFGMPASVNYKSMTVVDHGNFILAADKWMLSIYDTTSGGLQQTLDLGENQTVRDLAVRDDLVVAVTEGSIYICSLDLAGILVTIPLDPSEQVVKFAASLNLVVTHVWHNKTNWNEVPVDTWDIRTYDLVSGNLKDVLKLTKDKYAESLEITSDNRLLIGTAWGELEAVQVYWWNSTIANHAQANSIWVEETTNIKSTGEDTEGTVLAVSADGTTAFVAWNEFCCYERAIQRICLNGDDGMNSSLVSFENETSDIGFPIIVAMVLVIAVTLIRSFSRTRKEFRVVESELVDLVSTRNREWGSPRGHVGWARASRLRMSRSNKCRT